MSLLLILRRFARVVRSGWDDKEFRGLAIVVAAWVATGTIIYTIYEDWSVIDSLYFCVMTLTTIGYGDLAPTTDNMKLYTVVYAVLGIGFFVAFNARLVQIGFASRKRDDEAAQSPPAG